MMRVKIITKIIRGETPTAHENPFLKYMKFKGKVADFKPIIIKKGPRENKK